MSRPTLLDLFSGAGGSAVGYDRAGFDVVGVDIEKQPHYPFQFVQADALEYLRECGHCFDVIHCSPPCQAWSALKHLSKREHPQLIEPTRQLLREISKPYIIENVVGAPLIAPVLLCGSMFGLQTSCGAQLRRHRLFECNYLLMSPGECQHGERTLAVNGHEFRNEATRWAQRRSISVTGPGNAVGRTISVAGGHARDKAHEWKRARIISMTGSTPQQNVVRNLVRETFSVEEARRAMGIDWMSMSELSQAIPPVYCEWIGRQLREIIG
jgi:DNA (cytosine-5)-methyltransferase 1